MKPRHETSYPIHELLQKRWSPRTFSDRMMSEDQVMILFEAARWAASSSNEQPWRFIWSLKDNSEKYHKLFDCLKERNQEWAGSAPLLILTLTQNHFTESGKANPWANHDLGLAIGNLTTQATSMDLFVHSMAGFYQEKVFEHFDLPEGVEPRTMLVVGWLGDPAMLSELNQKREHQVQERKALKELFL